MPSSNEGLPFTVEEYRSRLARVRMGLAQRGPEVLLVTAPENIYYLSGYHTLGYFTFQMLIVHATEDPVLFTRGVNIDTARELSWLTRIEGYEDTQDPIERLHEVLTAYSLGSAEIGTQDRDWYFSYGQRVDLQHKLPATRFVDCSGLIEQIRLVKSPREIEYIEEAARTVGASLEAAIGAVQSGRRDSDVAAAMHRASIEAGSEYLGHPPMICVGASAGRQFATWNREVIRSEDVVYLEAGGSFKRYNAAQSRTVLVGQPSKEWRRIASASKDALEAAIAAIRPGVLSGEVDRAGQSVIAEAGLSEYSKHRTGYSMGIGFPPDWGEGRTLSIKKDDTTALESDMVFHLIPDMKVAGRGGAVFSDLVLVTETGSRTLTTFPRQLFSAD